MLILEPMILWFLIIHFVSSIFAGFLIFNNDDSLSQNNSAQVPASGPYVGDWRVPALGSNDTVIGYTGNDTFHGGYRDDRLNGLQGNGVLYGQGGRRRPDNQPALFPQRGSRRSSFPFFSGVMVPARRSATARRRP